jgi:hypothetical protein
MGNLARFALTIGAAALFAGCGGSQPPIATSQHGPSGAPHEIGHADLPDRGIYVSQPGGVSGYSIHNRRNKPPICTVNNDSWGDGIAVDPYGNLIATNAPNGTITVYQGPRMCGAAMGSISDPYGGPTDAASNNAATGKIAVANLFDKSGAGSISVCTLSGGCNTNLTNSNMHYVYGVAMGRNGDCWADATNSSGTATLTYFKNCRGSGQAATGFHNPSYGGLDIDAGGNLVTISSLTPAVYVYKSCNPACSLVGGPFAMEGLTMFGHLNKASTRLVAADYEANRVDIYVYSPSNLQYAYSFSNGIYGSEEPSDVAYSPH